MKHHLRASIIIVILCGCFTLLGMFVSATAALTPATTIVRQVQPTPAAENLCDELQAIFVVDQSSSMGGWTDEDGVYHPPTDPLGLRFQGPEFAVDTLIGLRARGFQTATIKVAAINFGSQSQVLLPWTELNPSSEEEADALDLSLDTTFDPVDSMVYTVPGPAVEQAASLFAQQDALRPQVDGCPRRLVILITDGLPFSDTSGFGWEAHLDELADYTNRYTPFPDYRLVVIGVDTDGSFYEDTAVRWAAVTGDPDQVLLARTPAEMASLMAGIISDVMNTIGAGGTVRGCVEDGQLIVPPYMQEISVSLYKVDPDLHLEIRDSTGQILSEAQDNVQIRGADSAIETVVVKNPNPGPWEVLTQLPPGTEDQCLVDFIALIGEGNVVEPVSGDRVLRFQKVPVIFQLTDGEGNPLPDYDDQRYDAKMDVGLAFADGEEQVLSLGANPGQQYQGEIIPITEGSVAVKVKAVAQDDNGVSYTIIDAPVSDFIVDPVYFIQQEGPTPDLSVGEYTSLPLAFAVVDSNDQVVELDAPVLVELNHLGPNGDALAAPSLSESGGVFTGELMLEEAGTHTLVYTATVQVPAQGNQSATSVALGSGEVAFDVFPVTLLHAEFVEPVGGVATDPFLRPTGLTGQVRLVDEAGQTVSPASTGAADPTQIFNVTITDQEGQVVLQGNDQLVATGEPGVFRLKPNELGQGEYAISVEPDTEVDERHAWAGREWSTPASGQINPTFFGVLAAALASVGMVALLIGGQMRVRQHPLSGSIQIYEERYETDLESGVTHTTERPLVNKALPNKNKFTFNPNVENITKITVTSPTEQMATSKSASAEILRKGQSPFKVTLTSGNQVQIPGTHFFIVKDPQARPRNDSNTVTLDSTY